MLQICRFCHWTFKRHFRRVRPFHEVEVVILRESNDQRCWWGKPGPLQLRESMAARSRWMVFVPHLKLDHPPRSVYVSTLSG